ncbi:MAG: SET domain-containing protein [Planctomycetota bacterium]
MGKLCPSKGTRGVYALEAVLEGEVLAVWGGRIITKAVLDRLPRDQHRLALQVEEDLYMLSTREGPADWINHSCNPNAGMQGQTVLVAMRNIDPGEEICFDYAMTDGSPYDEFTCRCGEPRCRGRITGEDWKKSDLWLQYDDYFSSYLARRIRKLRTEAGQD